MKNMRKILSAMTALGVITVAGTGTIACQNPLTAKLMNEQIKIDLGLVNKQDKQSTVTAKLAAVDGVASIDWSLKTLRPIVGKEYNGITASNLLDDQGKAKSKDAYDFLKGVLKITPIAAEAGKTDPTKDTFDKTTTDQFVLVIEQVSPTIKIKDQKTYTVSGGYVLVQWKNTSYSPFATFNAYGDVNKISLNSNDSNILPDEITGFKDPKLTSFDIQSELLKNFKKDAENNIKVGDNLFTALKSNSTEYQGLNAVIKTTGLSVSLKVTKFEGLTDGKWSDTPADNKIDFDLLIGEIKINANPLVLTQTS